MHFLESDLRFDPFVGQHMETVTLMELNFASSPVSSGIMGGGFSLWLNEHDMVRNPHFIFEWNNCSDMLRLTK